MKKKNKILLALIAFVSVLALGSISSIKASTDTDTIANGVYIGNVNVGGMTAEEAKSSLLTYTNSVMGTTFTLKGPNGSISATADDMGVTVDTDTAVGKALAIAHTGNLIDRYKQKCDLDEGNVVVDMPLSVDKQKTARLISASLDQLNIKAVNNGLTKTASGFTFIKGTTGNEVNVVDSVIAIDNYLASGFDGSDSEIELVSQEIEPQGTEEELAKIKDCLGSFSTDFSTSGAPRRANVTNGCSKINGTVLYPGEEFSVYETVSPFTAENGYEEAGSYENGTVVQTFGGGICQVSTTLYNAVIRAELDVVMRYNHSMIVTYVDPSDDAAIASGLKDFRFANNYSDPIYIEGYCVGSTITFNIYGVETREAGRSVSFESETLEEKDPGTTFVFSEEAACGSYAVTQSAHKGIKARLWKIVSLNGVEQSREVFNSSTYKAVPKYVTIGTKGISESALKAIKKAISTYEGQKEEEKDESIVQAAVAASAGGAEAKKDKDKDKDESDDTASDDTTDQSADQTTDTTDQITDTTDQTPVTDQTTDANSTDTSDQSAAEGIIQ